MRLATTVNCITREEKKTEENNEKKTVSVHNVRPSYNYRGALRSACGIVVWCMIRVALGSALPLDVNANGTRMHNRGVCARVYYMYMAPHCGAVYTCNRYVRCGRQDADYAAHMRLRLVLVL